MTTTVHAHVFRCFAAACLLLPALAGASILVDVPWLKAHIDDPDVRVVGSYQKGAEFDKEHIPGSVRVDETQDLLDPYSYPAFGLPQPKQFVALMNRLGIDNDTTVVIYDNSYQFASRLFVVMEYYGHPIDKLKILDGGITAWKAAGEPVTAGVTKVAARAPYVPGTPRTEITVERGDVMADVVRNPDNTHVLLDVRPLKEWTGEQSRTFRSGHIPKAIHHAGVDELMDKKSHKFRPAADIEFALQEKGITKDKPIYVYCQGGSRRPHAYVVLKHILGYPDVRGYYGGWVEWANLTAMPVADERWHVAEAGAKAPETKAEDKKDGAEKK